MHTRTVDLFSPIWVTFVVLMMVGVIPFTPVAVGAAILLSHCHLEMSWRR